MHIMDFAKLHPQMIKELTQMAREQNCTLEELDEGVVLATIEEIELEIIYQLKLARENM